MEERYTFTVFTATYNRATTLQRVWESLKRQTFRDFEWLIVDDGSSDNTREVVAAWTDVSSFSIRYIYQPHGHKKAAFERGVREAQGQLFLTLDSDDECTAEALERFWWHWNQIPAVVREHYSAVTALWAYTDGTVVGSRFPAAHYIDSDTIEICRRWKVKGDKWGFQRIDVLRRCIFYEHISGFVPEGIVWMQIAEQYKTRYVNEILGICHRDSDSGVTARLTDSRNPIPHAPGLALLAESVFRREWRYFRNDPGYFIRMAANFTRFRLHSGKALFSDVMTMAGAWLVYVMVPAGFAAYLVDRWRFRSGENRCVRP